MQTQVYPSDLKTASPAAGIIERMRLIECHGEKIATALRVPVVMGDPDVAEEMFQADVFSDGSAMVISLSSLQRVFLKRILIEPNGSIRHVICGQSYLPSEHWIKAAVVILLGLRGADAVKRQSAEVIPPPSADEFRQAFDVQNSRPQPEWVRGKCPTCGDDLVSNAYYIGGRGYVIYWECWSSLGETPTCKYRKAH